MHMEYSMKLVKAVYTHMINVSHVCCCLST